MNHRPIRRWSSWYDKNLVTQAGEDVLTCYDTSGIRELKKHKLIWGSWDGSEILSVSDHHPFPASSHGLRQIGGVDPRKLRLFFLSLLWRMAATNLLEFSEVVLPEGDLERLRWMVVNAQPEPLSFYPAQLIQLSTKGIIHNHTAILSEKKIPGMQGAPAWTENIIRFYFDGLVCHVCCQATDEGKTKGLGNLIVGNSDKLDVATVTFEGSLQREILVEIMEDTYSRWPVAAGL